MKFILIEILSCEVDADEFYKLMQIIFSGWKTTKTKITFMVYIFSKVIKVIVLPSLSYLD